MKVGFIGIGVMGGPMALNILKHGHELTVYDRSPEAVAGRWIDPRKIRSCLPTRLPGLGSS